MAGSNFVACIGPSYHLDDRKAAVQTAINCYLEQIEGLGETRTLTQVSAPGLAQRRRALVCRVRIRPV